MTKRRSPSAQAVPGRPAGKFTQTRRLERLREALEARPAGLTLDELATVLGVTSRSVRRYIQELKWDTDVESVQRAPNEPHIVRIPPSEQRRAVPLRRTQAYALLATRRLFEVFRGSALFEEIDLAFRQIQQIARRPGGRGSTEIALRADLDDRFAFVAPATGNYATQGEILDEIFRALAERRFLVVRVKPEFDEEKPVRAPGTPGTSRLRFVPEGLFAEGGTLYLVYAASSSTGEPQRLLRVDRITEAQVVDGAKGLAAGEPLPAEMFARGRFGAAFAPEKFTVVLEFDARSAELARRRRVHPDQRVASAADGRFRLGFPAGDLEAVARWVLSFGDGVRVIEPPELVVSIRATLTATLAKYR